LATGFANIYDHGGREITQQRVERIAAPLIIRN
jgi:hypothetical protein